MPDRLWRPWIVLYAYPGPFPYKIVVYSLWSTSLTSVSNPKTQRWKIKITLAFNHVNLIGVCYKFQRKQKIPLRCSLPVNDLPVLTIIWKYWWNSLLFHFSFFIQFMSFKNHRLLIILIIKLIYICSPTI